MAHESLYRAYRPQSFDEVAGQEQVTKPLSEAVKSGKIGHAYLFAGSRGLGKTSVARIFAKEIGCKAQDLYEVDAASNNSVEDIRALTEGVYTLPFESPYKVYILDEVHMLSKAAWNAFLKTLEEPPAYAVFILATTELDRVPETVQSRCQVFEFKKPNRKDLSKFIVKIGEREVNSKGQHYKVYQDAADLIAILADGSYRDALSILQKVLRDDKEMHNQLDIKWDVRKDKTNGPFIDRAWVEIWTGAPKRSQVHALLRALMTGNREKALETIQISADSGIDMRLFLELVLESLRNTILLRYAPDLSNSIKQEVGEDEWLELVPLVESSNFAEGITYKTLLAFLNASERIRYAPIPALPLELAVLELFPDEAGK